MQFNSIPADYASVYGDLIYKVGCDGLTDFGQAQIVCNGLTVGLKRFANSGSVNLNVAPCIRRFIDPEPKTVYFNSCAVNSFGGGSRMVKVVAGDAESDVRCFTAARQAIADFQVLSPFATKRVIARGDFDEITFPTPDASVSVNFLIYTSTITNYTLRTTSVTKGVRSVAVSMNNIEANCPDPENIRRFVVQITINSVLRITVNYAVSEPKADKVRLAWLNRFGAFTYWDFNNCVSRTLVADKCRMVASEGYRTVSSAVREYFDIATDYLPESTLEELSDLVGSPSVWLVDGVEASKLDVVNSSVVTFSRSLPILRVQCRRAQAENYYC